MNQSVSHKYIFPYVLPMTDNVESMESILIGLLPLLWKIIQLNIYNWISIKYFMNYLQKQTSIFIRTFGGTIFYFAMSHFKSFYLLRCLFEDTIVKNTLYSENCAAIKLFQFEFDSWKIIAERFIQSLCSDLPKHEVTLHHERFRYNAIVHTGVRNGV